MIDLIDLMNETFEMKSERLDDDVYQLSFQNGPADHEFYTTIDKVQRMILRSNCLEMYKKLGGTPWMKTKK